jgi:hypothetical protein
MQQPKGFEVGGPEYVCRLQKLLYGLKQAGRVWNETLHKPSCFLSIMSSHNSFAALALSSIANPFIRSSTPAPTPATPSVESVILRGSKCPRLSTQLPTLPRAALTPPKAMPASSPRPQDSYYSVFDVLNIFRSYWFINCKHLIANTLSATRDLDGRFTWVDFLPVFHTSLVKRMWTLLSSGFMVAHGKWVLFVFLLEILTSDKGPKPEVFWCARKKRSQASQKVCLATLTPTSAPPAPSPYAHHVTGALCPVHVNGGTFT